MRIQLSLAAAAALAACAATSEGGGAASAAPAAAGGPEPVYSATANDRGVRARVASNGCTTKSAFRADVSQAGADYVVTLVRTRPDTCPGFTIQGELISFSRDELDIPDGAAIRVANPIGPPRRL